MFENVTYDFYKDTLGCSAIPDEETFDSYKLENETFVKSIIDYVEEREADGLDSAVCMMIEESYKADKAGTDGRVETSRSIDGFSQSFDISKAQTADEKKMKWLRMFCYVSSGVA